MAVELGYLVGGALLLLVALIGSRLRVLPVSSALVYVLAGVAVGPAALGLFDLDPQADADAIAHVAELAVLIALLTAGLKLRTPLAHRRWVAPVLLATVAMAASAGLLALAGVLLLGLPLGAALVLGAALAPTDPVLASDVQTAHPWDRDRLRFTLTGEAGLNDGTAFPLVLLGLALLGAGDIGPWGLGWLATDLLWAAGAGIALGFLAGAATGRLVLHLRATRQEALGRDELLALGLLGVAFGAAELAHAYGFLAVFAAAVAFRRVELLASAAIDDAPEDRDAVVEALRDPEAEVRPDTAPAYMAQAVLGFAEQLERLAEALVVALLGVLLLAVPPTPALVWFAPLLFLVVRPLAVAATLLPLRPGRFELGLAAWFGIRGIGSLFYLAYALASGVLAGPDAELVTALVLGTIAISVAVHGISVTPLMRAYAARRSRRPALRCGAMGTPLEELPNVGRTLAHDLRAVGIADAEALRETGAVPAWQALRAAGLHDCRSSLCALEGAIRGVRWHDLPAAERDALWQEATEPAR